MLEGTKNGSYQYYIDFENLVAEQTKVNFGVTDEEHDKHFNVQYIDSKISAMYVGNTEFANNEIRVGSNNYDHGENILTSIYWRFEYPHCTFLGTIKPHYLHMVCVHRSNLVLYKIAKEELLQFPTLDEPYSYRGTIEYCHPNTDICKEFDIPAHGYDQNNFTIYDSKVDLHGRKYGTPTQYNETEGVIYYDPENNEDKFKIWIPVSNYYSGHLLDHEVTEKNKSSNDYYLKIKQVEKSQ